MTDKHTLLLPYPPSTNRLWRYSKNGVYRTPVYKAYIKECQRVQPAYQLWLHDPVCTPVSMQVWANPPDKRRRDLDNLCKALCDVIVHLGILEDDHWIHDLHLKWDREAVQNGVLIDIRPLNAAPATVTA